MRKPRICWKSTVRTVSRPDPAAGVYNFLPGAQEEWIRELRVVNRLQGIFLMAARTASHHYLYLVSSEGIEFQGNLEDGFLVQELIDFYGYENTAAFIESCTPLKEHCPSTNRCRWMGRSVRPAMP